MTEQQVLLISLAGIFVLGVGSQWIASRLRLPSILLLLATGITAGPVLGWIQPDELLHELVHPIVSLSVAVVLFEGSLSLRLRDLRKIGRPLGMVLTVGVVVTWVLSAWGAWWLLKFPLSTSLLLGAILTVTGPTVIGPLLRDIRPVGPVGPIARWEGIVIDPIGAVLAVLIFGIQDALQRAEYEGVVTTAVVGFTETMMVGLVIGTIIAFIFQLLLARHLIADHLQSPFALMLVVGSFAASNLIHHESGLVTVTVMGLVIANQHKVSVQHILTFKENLSVLLISSLFILLAARLDLSSVRALGWRGVWFVVFMILVVRPACVMLSSIGTALRLRERLFLSWLAPRGIVAAAVASVFALEMHDTPQLASEFASATFLVIVGTVVVYGLTAGPVARLLGLSVANPQGVLIASAHPGARAIAAALLKEQITVTLVDTNAANLRVARMEGLQTFHADILSDAAHHDLDLGGIGRLLALTPNDEVNSLAAMQFSELFGSAEVYRLSADRPTADRHKASQEVIYGRVAFAEFATYRYLDQRFEAGAILKCTPLTDEFTIEDFRQHYGDNAIVLFVVDDHGRLIIATADREPVFKAGTRIIALTDPPRSDEAS